MVKNNKIMKKGKEIPSDEKKLRPRCPVKPWLITERAQKKNYRFILLNRWNIEQTQFFKRMGVKQNEV